MSCGRVSEVLLRQAKNQASMPIEGERGGGDKARMDREKGRGGMAREVVRGKREREGRERRERMEERRRERAVERTLFHFVECVELLLLQPRKRFLETPYCGVIDAR